MSSATKKGDADGIADDILLCGLTSGDFVNVKDDNSTDNSPLPIASFVEPIQNIKISTDVVGLLPEESFGEHTEIEVNSLEELVWQHEFIWERSVATVRIASNQLFCSFYCFDGLHT